MEEKEPHFTGYWVTPPSLWPELGQPIHSLICLMFIDDGFMVRFDLSNKSNDNFNIEMELLSYIIDGSSIHITPAANTTSENDDDWTIAEWKIGDSQDMPLKFTFRDRIEGFFPASKKLLEEIGIPGIMLERWEKFARDRGLSFDPTPRGP